MTTEEKFNAAVNVIRSLPKNGSYQPSNDLMLRFYGYFKQATEGPCSPNSKPAFWDIVGRAKFTAWSKLGNMPKEEAMLRYVDELHRIVETMSLTANVANFLQAGDRDVLDKLPMQDLELIAGDVIEKVRSQPNSPLASRTPSPTPMQMQQNESDDEYIDTVESEVESIPSPTVQQQHTVIKHHTPASESQTNHMSNGSVVHVHPRSFVTQPRPYVNVSEELANTVASLQADLRALSQRMNRIEEPPTFTISPQMLLIFSIVWPFIAYRLLRAFDRK